MSLKKETKLSTFVILTISLWAGYWFHLILECQLVLGGYSVLLGAILCVTCEKVFAGFARLLLLFCTAGPRIVFALTRYIIIVYLLQSSQIIFALIYIVWCCNLISVGLVIQRCPNINFCNPSLLSWAFPYFLVIPTKTFWQKNDALFLKWGKMTVTTHLNLIIPQKSIKQIQIMAFSNNQYNKIKKASLFPLFCAVPYLLHRAGHLIVHQAALLKPVSLNRSLIAISMPSYHQGFVFKTNKKLGF